MQYTAIVKQIDGYWVGWIEEVPGVNCQENTHDELIASLKITLKEAIDFNKKDAITFAGLDFKEEIIAV
jgi:predicted RNase H-like HicB family nuclease